MHVNHFKPELPMNRVEGTNPNSYPGTTHVAWSVGKEPVLQGQGHLSRWTQKASASLGDSEESSYQSQITPVP